MFLARDDAAGAMSADTQKAFEQLWPLQRTEAPAKGAWKWYSANLDPWEHTESSYFGASLATLALGLTPLEYQQRADIRERTTALASFLATSSERPLHDRLALLWAMSTLPSALTDAARTALVAEVFTKQQPDGGWTLVSLGPWMPHPDAPPASGSEAYATAFTAFVLGEAGIAPSHAGLSRALSWLKTASGFFDRGVACGVDEQAPACGIDGSALHAGRRDSVCRARAHRGRESLARRVCLRLARAREDPFPRRTWVARFVHIGRILGAISHEDVLHDKLNHPDSRPRLSR